MTVDFLDSLRPLFDCLTDGFCIADAEGRLLCKGSVLTLRLPEAPAAEVES